MTRHWRRIRTRRHEAEAGLAIPQAAAAAMEGLEMAKEAVLEVEAEPPAVASASEALEVGPRACVSS